MSSKRPLLQIGDVINIDPAEVSKVIIPREDTHATRYPIEQLIRDGYRAVVIDTKEKNVHLQDERTYKVTAQFLNKDNTYSAEAYEFSFYQVGVGNFPEQIDNFVVVGKMYRVVDFRGFTPTNVQVTLDPRDKEGFVVWYQGHLTSPTFNSKGAAEAYADGLRTGARKPEWPTPPKV